MDNQSNFVNPHSNNLPLQVELLFLNYQYFYIRVLQNCDN